MRESRGSLPPAVASREAIRGVSFRPHPSLRPGGSSCPPWLARITSIPSPGRGDRGSSPASRNREPGDWRKQCGTRGRGLREGLGAGVGRLNAALTGAVVYYARDSKKGASGMGKPFEGTRWTKWITGFRLNGIAYGGCIDNKKVFAAVGDGGILLTSSDGTKWATKTLRSSLRVDNLKAAACGGLFVVVGDNDAIFTYQDGEWRSPYQMTIGSGMTLNASLRGVAYGSVARHHGQEIRFFAAVGAVAAAGDSGVVFTSSDGVTWKVNHPSSSPSLFGIANGKDLFVAVGKNGAIFTSLDMANWTKQTSGTKEDLHGVAYGGNLFVAVGKNGAILISPDGVNWQGGTSKRPKSLHAVTYSEDHSAFVAVGQDGTVLASSDGITWEELYSEAGEMLYGVACGEGRCVAVGDGIILTST